MRKAEDCQRWADGAAAHFGGLDILVNCAAGNFLAAAEMLSPNGFRTGAGPGAPLSEQTSSHPPCSTLSGALCAAHIRHHNGHASGPDQTELPFGFI